MAGHAHGVLRLPGHRIALRAGEDVGVGGLRGVPSLVVRRLIDHHLAAHGEMADAAQLLAQHLELAHLGGLQPQVGDQARHQIHLHPKLGDGEVVQHVLGAQVDLDVAADRQMHHVALDQPVVLAVGIVRIHAEGVVVGDELGVHVAELAVIARQPVAPVPLLADGLNFVGVLRHGDEFRPDDQAGRQHGGDADRGDGGQPKLKLVVLRLVFGPLLLVVAELDDAIGHETVDGNEDNARHPEGNVDREVDQAPIGGQGGQVPRAQNVKKDRANDQNDQCNSKCHLCSFLN